MRPRTAILLLLMWAAPAVAHGQTAEERIERARQRVTQAGLPVDLVDDRIAEGRAKRVPAARIAEAVERRASALLDARDALRPLSRTVGRAELAAGADAVEAGLPGSAIRDVAAQARVQDRPVALAVLTFLHQERGLPTDEAVRQVTAALARGPEALRNLPAQAAGRGRPDRPGVGAPEGAGRPPGAGPPAGVPAPGGRPDAGRPDGAGPPNTPGGPDAPGRGRP